MICLPRNGPPLRRTSAGRSRLTGCPHSAVATVHSPEAAPWKCFPKERGPMSTPYEIYAVVVFLHDDTIGEINIVNIVLACFGH